MLQEELLSQITTSSAAYVTQVYYRTALAVRVQCGSHGTKIKVSAELLLWGIVGSIRLLAFPGFWKLPTLLGRWLDHPHLPIFSARPGMMVCAPGYPEAASLSLDL